MKSILITIMLFLFCGTYAQVRESEVVAMMEARGYSVSTTQYADLAEGQSARHWKTFYSGNEYVIAAFPEESGVYDLDIYMYYTDGTLFMQDTDSNNIAALTFTCRNSNTEAKVVIKNYDSSSSTYEYRCKFIVFYKNL